jgi:DNA mismatch endonuclease (patch repair protein)
MRSNRARATRPERVLKGMLRSAGEVGYRANWNGVPGRPDTAFPSLRVAIFVHGCYWHRCPKCRLALPQSHREFWKHKFERNVARDRRKLAALSELGWDTLVVWECELRESPTGVMRRLLRRLETARKVYVSAKWRRVVIINITDDGSTEQNRKKHAKDTRATAGGGPQ